MASARVFIVVSQQLVDALNEAHPKLQLELGSCFVGEVVLDVKPQWDGTFLRIADSRMGDLLIPMILDGAPALKELPKAQVYVVSNSELRSSRPGLSYRNRASWDSDAKLDMQLAIYGSQVGGVPYDEEWLQVGELFLPFKVNDCQVLRPANSTMESAAALREPIGNSAEKTGLREPPADLEGTTTLERALPKLLRGRRGLLGKLAQKRSGKQAASESDLPREVELTDF